MYEAAKAVDSIPLPNREVLPTDIKPHICSYGSTLQPEFLRDKHNGLVVMD